MSFNYWGIVGYGISESEAMKYVDTKKVNNIIRTMTPVDDNNDVFEDDTFHGDPYTCFSEFLAELDDSHIMSWEVGGEMDENYFLYVPVYPWRMQQNEPRNPEEVEDAIVKVLAKISNQSENEIKGTIDVDYISATGCG